MRRLAVPVLLLFSLVYALAAKQTPTKTADPGVAQTPAQEKAPKPAGTEKDAKPADENAKAGDQNKDKKDYSQEGFVIEQVRTLFRFESDGTGRKETIARVRVQSEAGVEQWGQVVIGYSSANERVEIPYVRVLKKDGTVVTAPADAVQDLSAPVAREAPVYTDYRQKHITVPGLRPGEVLEYDVATIIHTPLAPNQFWT